MVLCKELDNSSPNLEQNDGVLAIVEQEIGVARNGRGDESVVNKLDLKILIEGVYERGLKLAAGFFSPSQLRDLSRRKRVMTRALLHP